MYFTVFLNKDDDDDDDEAEGQITHLQSSITS